MNNNYYQSTPDSYVRFKWRGQELEGEFFRHNNFLIFFDDPLDGRGFIRPFDKDLRQSILDARMKHDGVDLELFCRRSDLITCDSLINHPDLYTYLDDIIVEDFVLIKQDELKCSKEIIADCRADLLKRQYILSNALNEEAELSLVLEKEFKVWVTPTFKPLRYSRTKFQKFKSSGIIHFICLIIFLVLLM